MSRMEERMKLKEDYSEFVQSLCKDMGSKTDNILHAAVGIAGEAGELIDAVKKHWAYEKKLNLENMKEELGDLFFYIQEMLNQLELTEEECKNANIDKLRKRYSEGKYSNEQAIARADKNEASSEWNVSDPSVAEVGIFHDSEIDFPD